MAIVAAIATIIGTVISVSEQKKAASEAKKAGRRRRDELRRAAEAERERQRRLAARQAAIAGAQGVEQTGSPALLRARTILDSIDRADRALRGAENDFENTRARAQGLEAGAFGTLFAGLGQTVQIGIDAGFFDPNRSSTVTLPSGGTIELE